jgi:hypothetical protein
MLRHRRLCIELERVSAESESDEVSPRWNQSNEPLATPIVLAPQVIAAVAVDIAAIPVLAAIVIVVILVLAAAILTTEFVAAIIVVVATVALLAAAVIIVVVVATFAILAPEIVATITIIVAVVALLAATCEDITAACDRWSGNNAGKQQLDRLAPGRPNKQARPFVELPPLHLHPPSCSRRTEAALNPRGPTPH